ncbi:MAG: HAD-IC family P-type ATPase [Gemmataceae bacterium]
MSRRAMVQRLNAVETMAGIDVVCTDKTGTLTTNHLTLVEILPLDDRIDLASIRADLAIYASTTIDRDNRNMAALRANLGDTPTASIDQLPFKSQNRCSAMRFEAPHGPRLLVMGAVEALASRLEHGVERLPDLVQPRQKLGQRLILLTEGPGDVVLAGQQTLPECRLRPLAMICLGDELRPEAGPTLMELHAQGIRFKVISGDNPETVRGTVQHLDLEFTNAPVVSGDELAASADRVALIRDRSVFGRIAPHQKVEIVETLQQLGHRVAMIGDGVNDVLPIKKADLGIAMGAGSQASKTVSGLVLETNRFDLLPETLEEGRTILRNLRRSGKLFLTKNVYSFVLILGYFLGLPFPYEPQQVTLLNWSVIGIPAFVIALTRERSIRPSKTDFFRDLVGFSLLHGVVIGIAGLAVLAIATWLHPGEGRIARTMLLTHLVLLGLVVLLRAMNDGETADGSRWLRLLALLALPIVALAVYIGPIARFFQLASLNLQDILVVMSAAAMSAFLLSFMHLKQVRKEVAS